MHPRFEHTCAFAAFPATCFRFEPGLGAEGQLLGSDLAMDMGAPNKSLVFRRSRKERFKGLEDVSVEEPCTQSAWSSQARKSSNVGVSFFERRWG